MMWRKLLRKLLPISASVNLRSLTNGQILIIISSLVMTFSSEDMFEIVNIYFLIY